METSALRSTEREFTRGVLPIRVSSKGVKIGRAGFDDASQLPYRRAFRFSAAKWEKSVRPKAVNPRSP